MLFTFSLDYVYYLSKEQKQKDPRHRIARFYQTLISIPFEVL